MKINKKSVSTVKNNLDTFKNNYEKQYNKKLLQYIVLKICEEKIPFKRSIFDPFVFDCSNNKNQFEI